MTTIEQIADEIFAQHHGDVDYIECLIDAEIEYASLADLDWAIQESYLVEDKG